MKQFLILILLIFIVAMTIAISHGANNILDAQANKSRAMTYQAERDKEFNRSVAIAKEAERKQVWEDTYAYRVIASGMLVIVLAVVASAALVATSVAYSKYAYKIADVKVLSATSQAALIYPDKETGMFPLIPDNFVNPKFIVDTNTGGVWKLDVRVKPDAQMIDARERVQVAHINSKGNYLIRSTDEL